MDRSQTNAEQGMKSTILKIRLAMEAKRYDVMVERVREHLEQERERKSRRKYQQQQEFIKSQEEANLNKQTSPNLGDQDQVNNDKYENKQEGYGMEDEHGNKAKMTYNSKSLQDTDNLDKNKMKYEFDTVYKANVDNPVFDEEELELIACAFKSQLKEVRKAIKSIDILATKQRFDSKGQGMESYQQGLVYDMIQKGENQVKIIDEFCLEQVASPKAYIFFKKLKGDIYRYLAEHTHKYQEPIKINEDQSVESADLEGLEEKDSKARTKYKDKAWMAYKEAKFMSKLLSDHYSLQNNDQIDSVRLGLSLNYAVFLWEVIGSEDQKKKALRMLKREIQNALDDFDKWKEKEREKISQQVELIQENINLWKQAVDEDSAEEN